MKDLRTFQVRGQYRPRQVTPLPPAFISESVVQHTERTNLAGGNLGVLEAMATSEFTNTVSTRLIRSDE